MILFKLVSRILQSVARQVKSRKIFQKENTVDQTFSIPNKSGEVRKN